jgi:ATP-binding cassette subfamily B protein
VDQSPFFFHTTIKENLLFAAPGATPSECEQAARQAGVHEFICSLPNEYETVLGERGLSLSVGQRQRLAIARALLRRPALLILDEPSAALDPHAELALAETLRGLASRCTILVVTHRAALVGIADQVIVLEEGRIAKSEAAIARHFGIQQSAGAAFV